MARATAMEAAIKNGGVLIIDEIEDRLHPMLVEYIIKSHRVSIGKAQQMEW